MFYLDELRLARRGGAGAVSQFPGDCGESFRRGPFLCSFAVVPFREMIGARSEEQIYDLIVPLGGREH